MQVVIAGASGLIGSALVPELRGAGHEVIQLVRREPGPGEARWDPAAGKLDPALLREADAAIVLSGENIAEGRWTAAKRRRILSSRVDTAGLVAQTIACVGGPRVLLAASAIGYYGSQGDQVVDESAGLGEGYLAEVCRAWEAASAPAADAGTRVVNLRIGLVLGRGCPLFDKALPLYRFGLGGVMGDPDDFVSWISLRDTTRLLRFALESEQVRGPLNVVSPHPVTNRELTAAIASALGRPALLRYPAWVMSLAVGRRAARELFGRSFRVAPQAALEAGFEFEHPRLAQALAAELGRDAA